MQAHKFPSNVLLILVFTVLGFAVMGYHPGAEDDGIYLSAIKSDLNPALFPHDAEFFRLQLQATFFDKWVAGLVQLTGIPVAAMRNAVSVGGDRADSVRLLEHCTHTVCRGAGALGRRGSGRGDVYASRGRDCIIPVRSALARAQCGHRA